jgi:hypothetical protein
MDIGRPPQDTCSILSLIAVHRAFAFLNPGLAEFFVARMDNPYYFLGDYGLT